MTGREKILLGVLGVLVVGYLSMKKWEVPKEAAPYLVDIRNAEATNGLPHDLLARLLWVESHYRKDIISGATISKAGAIGIAQIVPKWHPNVNPRDPKASIRYAGQFLAQLKKQLGTWDKAVAGYNTGAGNVQKAIAKASTSGRDWLEHVADETQNYVREIIPVVGLSRNV
jgi:soluble lytic murein transglycosylase-like protein